MVQLYIYIYILKWIGPQSGFYFFFFIIYYALTNVSSFFLSSESFGRCFFGLYSRQLPLKLPFSLLPLLFLLFFFLFLLYPLFDIVAGVLQGDTLSPYLFIICLDYVLRTWIDKIRENDFELTKKRSRRYPAKTITDAVYANDIALLANTPNKAETLLHRLERAAADIGLHVNTQKTEYMCYNQTVDITTLDGAFLKLVDKFTYLRSSVSSTEKDIDTRLTKAWTAIDRLSIIWKSDLTDKMKRSFFQAAVVSILLYGCTTWTLTKRPKKKLDGNYTRILRAILTSPVDNTPQDTNYTATCLPSCKLYKLDEPHRQNTAREARTNS